MTDAGWISDGKGTLHYWDGQGWTGHTHPEVVPPARRGRPPVGQRLWAASALLAWWVAPVVCILAFPDGERYNSGDTGSAWLVAGMFFAAIPASVVWLVVLILTLTVGRPRPLHASGWGVGASVCSAAAVILVVASAGQSAYGSSDWVPDYGLWPQTSVVAAALAVAWPVIVVVLLTAKLHPERVRAWGRWLSRPWSRA